MSASAPAAAAAAAAAAPAAASIRQPILDRILSVGSTTLLHHDTRDEQQLGVGEAAIRFFHDILVVERKNTHLLGDAAVIVACAPLALGTPLHMLAHPTATATATYNTGPCGIYGRSLILTAGQLPQLLQFCQQLVLAPHSSYMHSGQLLMVRRLETLLQHVATMAGATEIHLSQSYTQS